MFLFKSAKSPFYQLTYEVKGKRTTVSTRTSSLVKAQLFLAGFQPKVANMPRQPEPEKVTKQDPTLLQFQKEYVGYLSNTKSPNYIRSVNLSFKMLYEFCGDLKLRSLHYRLIDSFISQTFHRAKRSAALYYRTLKAAINTAIKWEYMDNNPFCKVKFPKLPQSHPTFITLVQLKNILAHDTKENIRVICLMAFYTGMRINEILNLKWHSVDLLKNVIHLRNTKEFTTKSKKERIIPIAKPLTKELLKIFNNQPHSSYLLIDRRGQKYNSNFVSKKFKKLVRIAGLDEKIHFHSLRHSFASNLVQRGASIYVVKELLGHEDIKTTMIYSHLNQNSLKNAIELLK